jgi:beta-mannanase
MNQTNNRAWPRPVAVFAASLACAAMVLGLAIGSPPAHSQSTDKRLVLTEDAIMFGAYDPYGDFAGEKRASVEHIFMPWDDVDLSDLPRVDAYARERGRMLMITVEPWTWSAAREAPDELLNAILTGQHDAEITAVCSAISELKSPISIRWGQEMEDPAGPFPWAKWQPKDFIAAYQHFVTECKKHLPEATYIWSPKGLKQLGDFYPGDQYVDVVGLSLFGYQPYDEAEFGEERTFAKALEPSYRAAEGFGKPIIVAELGYEGDAEYVDEWVEAAAAPYCQFPQLAGVVYFNALETFEWPRNMGRPDWRLGKPPTVESQAKQPESQILELSQDGKPNKEMNHFIDKQAIAYRQKHC